MKKSLLVFLLLSIKILYAQDTADRKLSVHAQATVIPQYHFKFRSPYQGTNSLLPSEPVKTSLTATLFLNYHPLKNLYFIFNPEAAGGKGLSKTLGMAGFPNGEIYRVGDPAPKPYIARLYAEYHIPLTKEKIFVEDGVNTVQEHAPAKYISILAGKFSITDFFDGSFVSHDPRTQFLNWSLMASGAWDYPANVRGYTMGTVAQVFLKDWTIRGALTAVPMEANGQNLQFKAGKAMGTALEVEKDKIISKDENHFTDVRIGVFYNKARMGNYEQTLKTAQGVPDITGTRLYARDKKGIYGIIDNQIGKVQHFIRASYNDGKNETWAFTEIDRSIATGFSFNGSIWKRKNDLAGIAAVVNGLSKDHRTYLAAGGYGFLIGDGKLNYGTENIIEAFYSVNVFKSLFITPDYQFVLHPAYNKDRGPVNIVALRLHYTL